MNFGNILRKALPYIVAVVVFWVASVLYFAPQYNDMTLAMNDVQQYEGMGRDIWQHREATGEDPQWTGGMFGGMPAYLISVEYPAMFLRNATGWLAGQMGEPTVLMFLAMAGFWLMLLMAGVNPWVAIPMALAYGLSTYNILIIEAGHITKMRAMGWAPMLVGAVFWTFRQPRPWVGGALAALFGALTIAASHHQITYYFLLVAAAFWIGELVATARAKEGWRRFCVATGVLGFAAMLAAGANFTHLWYTFEHSPQTIRGGSELVAGGLAEGSGSGSGGDAAALEITEQARQRGLDLEYATAWSYGVGESVNMFIPNFRGGASSGGFAPDGQVASVLRRSGYDPAAAQQLPGYWGRQPFTGGPTYLGAVAVFLFVLGMFVLPGRKKWWVLGVSVPALLLAWGHNAMWFTEFAFAVMPGLDKFRTVSMALVVLQWSVPFVAALVMSTLWKGNFEKMRFMRGLLWALGLAGGTALFFALFGGWIYDFSGMSDAQFAGIPGLEEAMRSERAAMLRADSWRSLVFVLLTAGVVWLQVRGVGKGTQGVKEMRDTKGLQGGQEAAKGAVVAQGGLWRWLPVAAVGALVLADLVPVDLRFLTHDDFRTRSRIEVKPDGADLAIMEDKEPGYRVFNTSNPFQEAYTSYFHRSVGGYHGAKLARYQDVIDRYLSKFDMGVLNMLNAKYFIVGDPETGERTAQLNPDANGAAWFVSEVRFADGPREELDALGTMDLRQEAVADRRFEDAARIGAAGDTVGEATEIILAEYAPNYLRYEVRTEQERVAVFSEIYYDKGWKAYIDRVEAPYFRADYILRAMVVPAGVHTIEWRFRAPRFALLEGITLGCSIAILMCLAAAMVFGQSGWRPERSGQRKNESDDGTGR